MQLIEVSSSGHKRAFLEFPKFLCKQFPNWISPLDDDIEAVFDPSRNHRFKNGEAIRWILQDGRGKTIGRIAAFIDRSIAFGEAQPTGGVGFFECIHDQQAAFLLFEAAQQWLHLRGMEAMDGPVNFGDRDRFWGLHVEGDLPPTYGMFYHLPYYKDLFEAYGFKEYFKQFTFYRQVMKPLHEAVLLRASRIRNNPDYVFTHFRMKEADVFGEFFRLVYNRAWVKHLGVSEMTLEQSKDLMRKMKPIIDEKLIWFGFYKGEPIAFFVMLPEMNQYFRHLNGKLDLKGMLTFLWHKWRKTCRKMMGIVFGVVPEHQGKGVETAIVCAARDVLQESYRQYDDMEMNWIGDFNTAMIKTIKMMGAEQNKTYITYRKLFDPSKPFERHPITN
jgi:hypothetical protein